MLTQLFCFFVFIFPLPLFSCTQSCLGKSSWCMQCCSCCWRPAWLPLPPPPLLPRRPATLGRCSSSRPAGGGHQAWASLGYLSSPVHSDGRTFLTKSERLSPSKSCKPSQVCCASWRRVKRLSLIAPFFFGKLCFPCHWDHSQESCHCLPPCCN